MIPRCIIITFSDCLRGKEGRDRGSGKQRSWDQPGKMGTDAGRGQRYKQDRVVEVNAVSVQDLGEVTPQSNPGMAWWHMFVIPAAQRLRQENCKLMASLGNLSKILSQSNF